MNHFAGICFAQFEEITEAASKAWHGMNAATREWVILLGALALVILTAVVWAAFFRRRRRRHHHHHRSAGAPEPTSVAAVAPARGPNSAPRRRRRRRRRDHRPRNPTLAETGGLPPLRADPPPDTPI